MAKNLIKRKNKATKITFHAILNAIEQGHTIKDAAVLSGVDKDTIS